jgi:hypothetical protein
MYAVLLTNTVWYFTRLHPAPEPLVITLLITLGSLQASFFIVMPAVAIAIENSN